MITIKVFCSDLDVVYDYKLDAVFDLPVLLEVLNRFEASAIASFDYVDHIKTLHSDSCIGGVSDEA